MSFNVPSNNGCKNHCISRQQSSFPPVRRDEGRQEPSGAAFFTNAQDFVINGGRFKLTQRNQYVNDTISNRRAVFELLEPYTCLDATKDSSARHPPPKCHPGTRTKIRDRLMRWLLNQCEWKMLWVRGFAGTGKSAVAQSFADSCDEDGIFGGSFFFFRAAGRNKPNTVVPTLVYQLAINIPEYQSFIEHRLAQNPLLLQNSPPIQFRKLIVEPFAVLQREHPRTPTVIILDGFDECEGEDAQNQILEMIADAIRTNPNLPLRWLIFSRPEAHLKNAFSRNSVCGREELIIDAECRTNVEKYIKDELLEIKVLYRDVIPANWPSKGNLRKLFDTVSGLFILASTCVNYIGDPKEADPVSQLDTLLRFICRFQGVVSRNPLATLDLLYSRILEDIHPKMFTTTWRILAHLSLQSQMHQGFLLDSAQALCNFLRLDQHTFYKAVRGLHCVMWIPDLEDAGHSQLQFHHASFQDFLLDPLRSGQFAIDKRKASLDILKSGIYWHEIDVLHFHMDGLEFVWNHTHAGLPGLSWASETNRASISTSILNFVQFVVFTAMVFQHLDNADEDFFSQACNIDFRHWSPQVVFNFALGCRLDPSNPIIRREPSNSTDRQLLENFNLVIKNGVTKPAVFPLRLLKAVLKCVREYFFIGYGAKSVIVYRTSSGAKLVLTRSLCCDKRPSGVQISRYEKDLQRIGWDEGKAKLDME